MKRRALYEIHLIKDGQYTKEFIRVVNTETLINKIKEYESHNIEIQSVEVRG